MSIKFFYDLIYKRNEKMFNDYGIDEKRIKMIKDMIERSETFVSLASIIVAIIM